MPTFAFHRFLIAGSLLFLLDCKKGDASGGCTSAHTAVPEFGVCIKVPSAWKLQEKTATSVTWHPDDGGIFSIDFDPSAKQYEDINNAIGQDPANQSGTLAGGKGKWVYHGPTAKSGAAMKVAVVGSKGGLVTCGLSGMESSVKKTLEICKTIAPL
jgi:hypothetical protein